MRHFAWQHTQTHAHTRTHTQTHTRTHVCVCGANWARTFVCVCVCVYCVSLCLNVYLCLCHANEAINKNFEFNLDGRQATVQVLQFVWLHLLPFARLLPFLVFIFHFNSCFFLLFSFLLYFSIQKQTNTRTHTHTDT